METYSSLRRLISSNAVMRTVRNALLDCGLGDPDLLRAVLEGRVQSRGHRLGSDLEAAQQRGDESLVLLEQREQQMLGLDSRMLQLLCRLLCGGQRLLGTFSKSIKSHGSVNTTARRRLTLRHAPHRPRQRQRVQQLRLQRGVSR